MTEIEILNDPNAILPTEAINILSGTICVSVKLSRFGLNRKVRSSEVEVNADRKMIRVSKQILDSPELKAIIKIDTQIRQMLHTFALPASNLFRGGIYCLPAQSAPLVDEQLVTFAALREPACQAFYDAWPRLCDEAQGQLRALHNPLDYPSLDTVKRAFNMETQYINIGVPQNLEGISKAIFEREKTKQAAKMTEAADEIKLALRAMMKELVDHMVDRLTPDEGNLDENGQPKPKKFHASMVERMGTFLELFEAKNITNDTELAFLVGKAKAIMNNVDPKSLRSNDDLRSYVTRELSTVKASLDTMVVEGGGRLYQDVGDDDAEEAA